MEENQRLADERRVAYRQLDYVWGRLAEYESLLKISRFDPVKGLLSKVPPIRGTSTSTDSRSNRGSSPDYFGVSQRRSTGNLTNKVEAQIPHTIELYR